MEVTPERKQGPTRGSIINSSINLSNQRLGLLDVSQISGRVSGRNSVRSSFTHTSDGAANFKPMSSSKISFHGGDAPQLGKHYNPLRRSEKKQLQANQSQHILPNEILRATESMNESTFKQFQDTGRNFLPVKQSHQSLSFVNKVVDLNISVAPLDLSDDRANHTTHSDHKDQKVVILSTSPTPIGKSISSARNSFQMAAMQAANEEQSAVILQPTYRSSQYRPTSRNQTQGQLINQVSNESDEMDDVDEMPYQPAKPQNDKLNLKMQTIGTYELGEMLNATPRDPFTDRSSAESKIKFLIPQASQDSGEIERIDNDKYKRPEDTISNMYTINHRVEAFELNTPVDDQSVKKDSFESRIKIQLEKSVTDNPNPSNSKLFKQDFSNTQAKDKVNVPVPLKTKFKSDKQVKGVVRTDLDVDSIINQVKKAGKKKKRKRMKTGSSKSSYSYYTESCIDYDDNLDSSMIKEEDNEDEKMQIKIEAASPTLKLGREFEAQKQHQNTFSFAKPTQENGDVIFARNFEEYMGARSGKFQNSEEFDQNHEFTTFSAIVEQNEDISEIRVANDNDEMFIQRTFTPNNKSLEQTDKAIEQQRITTPTIGMSSIVGTNTGQPASQVKHVQPSFLKAPTLKPVGELPKHFIIPKAPGAKTQPKKAEVIKYELGGPAIEIQTPNYATIYKDKLKHIVRLKNGDPCPDFVRAKVTQAKRLVIRIHQEDPVGIDQEYNLMVNVYHGETGIYDTQEFKLKVKAKKKFTLLALNFNVEQSFALSGPGVMLPMPSYNVDDKRLTFTFELDQFLAQNFAKVEGQVGSRCIRLKADKDASAGVYVVTICAKDSVSGIVNSEAKFKAIIAADQDDEPNQPIAEGEEDDQEPEIADEMPVVEDVDQQQIGLDEYVKWQDQMMTSIRLQGADKKRLETIQEERSVDPALQLSEEQTLAPVKYHVSGQPIEIAVPSYSMRDRSLQSRPQLRLSDIQGQELPAAITIITNDRGQQVFRIHSDDTTAVGKYKVRVAATDSISGQKNNEAQFDLEIEQPVLQLASLPPEFQAGKRSIYLSGSDPLYINLPQYQQQESLKLKYFLTDVNGDQLPDFINLETKSDKRGTLSHRIVVHGNQHYELKNLEVYVHVIEEKTGSKQVHSLNLQMQPYSLKLNHLGVPESVQFNVGDNLTFPLPSYTQSDPIRMLQYTVEDPSSLIKVDKGQIVISGGTSANQGTHQICVVATEPKSGVCNREAVFSLAVTAKLIFDNTFAEGIKVNIGNNCLIDAPKVKNCDSAEYKLICYNNETQQNIKLCQVDSATKIKISTEPIPDREVFIMQLEVSDKERNISETLVFTVTFNLMPKVTLLAQPDEISYTIGDVPEQIGLPEYSTYPVKGQNLEFTLESRTGLSESLVIQNGQVQTDDDGLVGSHQFTIVARDQQTGVENREAVLKVHVKPKPQAAVGSLFEKKQQSSRRQKSSRKPKVNEVTIPDSSKDFASESEKTLDRCNSMQDIVSYQSQLCEVNWPAILKPAAAEISYQIELQELVTTGMVKPQVSEICRSDEFAESFMSLLAPYYSPNHRDDFRQCDFQLVVAAETPLPVFDFASDRVAQFSENSFSFQSVNSENFADGTLPNSVKNDDIQDPTHTQKSQLVEDSDEAISNMSQIIRQAEEIVEDEDVIPNLASTQSNPLLMLETGRVKHGDVEDLYHSTRKAAYQNIQCQTSPSREKQASAKDDKINDSQLRHQISNRSQKDPDGEEDQVRVSLLTFQNQLHAMQQLQQQQIEAHQASHQLLLQQQRLATENQNATLNQSFQNQSFNQVKPNNFGQVQMQQLQQFLTSNQALFDEIKLQEDIDLNKQIKLQIQQSIQRRQQQQATLEQLQQERNVLQQNQIGQPQFHRNIYDATGQLWEKDQILKSLKNELQQSWEQRAHFRQELNALQQREDDLQAEIFFKDNQIKSTTVRNSELSTKISELSTRPTSPNHYSFAFAPHRPRMEESYAQISRFEEIEMETKMLTASKRLERLKRELEDLNGQIARSEAQIEFDRGKMSELERQLIYSQVQSRLAAAQLPISPQVLPPTSLQQDQPTKTPKPTKVNFDVDDTIMTEDLLDNDSFMSPPPRGAKPQQQVRTSQPYRPVDNNIFGTSNDNERNRFQTTYSSMNQDSSSGKGKDAVRQRYNNIPQTKMVQPIIFAPPEDQVAGMRSDYKQRKADLKEQRFQQGTYGQLGPANFDPDPDDRSEKLKRLNAKLSQERAKLMKMLQSSSTSNAMRYHYEQQLAVVEDKMAIVQGKIKRK